MNIGTIRLFSPDSFTYTPPHTGVIRGHANLVSHFEAECLRANARSLLPTTAITGLFTWHDLSDTESVFNIASGDQPKFDNRYSGGTGNLAYVVATSGANQNRYMRNITATGPAYLGSGISNITLYRHMPNVSLEGQTTVIFFAAPSLNGRLMESSGNALNWLVRLESDGQLSSNTTTVEYKTAIPGGILKSDYRTRLNMYTFRLSTVSSPGVEYIDIRNNQAVSLATLGPALTFSPTGLYGRQQFTGVNYINEIGGHGGVGPNPHANIASFMVFNTHLSLSNIYDIYMEQQPRFNLSMHLSPP
jgi:hypothetical protein